MKLVARPGIVPVTICGVRFLIPTRAASEECPHIQKLSLITALIWSCYEKNMPEQNIREAIGVLTKRDDPEVDELWKRAVEGFVEKGFLIRVEDDEP